MAYNFKDFVCYCGCKTCYTEDNGNKNVRVKMINNQFVTSLFSHLACSSCGLMFDSLHYNYDVIKNKIKKEKGTYLDSIKKLRQ